MKLFRAPLVEEMHVYAVLLAENIAAVTETFPPIVLAALALTPLTEVAPVKGKPKTDPFYKRKGNITMLKFVISMCIHKIKVLNYNSIVP